MPPIKPARMRIETAEKMAPPLRFPHKESTDATTELPMVGAAKYMNKSQVIIFVDH
jgi:hypothetical protein